MRCEWRPGASFRSFVTRLHLSDTEGCSLQTDVCVGSWGDEEEQQWLYFKISYGGMIFPDLFIYSPSLMLSYSLKVLCLQLCA